jgi:hypothetical protein
MLPTAYRKARAESNSRSRREVVIMPQIIMIAAAVGAALLLGSVAASRLSTSAAQPGGTAVAALATPEQVSPVPRCGGEPAEAGPAAAPPRNAYMTVNGRVFTLFEVLTCAKRLHTARFS